MLLPAKKHDMKQSIIKLLLSAALMHSASAAVAFDPSSLLDKLKGDSTATSQGKLGSIGNALGNLFANDKFEIEDIVGQWSYVSPAVSFQSDNALMTIGGAGAATAIEEKLEPYYKRMGFNKTTLVVNEDHSFTLKMGVLSMKGTIEKGEDNNLVFNFSAFGKVKLGKVASHATKAGSTLNLTFDATRMIEMLEKVSSFLNNSTLSSLSKMLSSYEGIYIGFKLNGTK